jgi:hypothetical protein
VFVRQVVFAPVHTPAQSVILEQHAGFHSSDQSAAGARVPSSTVVCTGATV